MRGPLVRGARGGVVEGGEGEGGGWMGEEGGVEVMGVGGGGCVHEEEVGGG